MSSNTRSDTVVVIRITAAQPGDILSDDLARELERRITATLDVIGSVGDAVVSGSPPDDTTKVWYPSDSNGVPTGEQYVYNESTNSWQSTSQTIPDVPCRVSSSDNLIEEGAGGCWIVSSSRVREVVDDDLTQLQNSIDALEENTPIVSPEDGNYLEDRDSGFYVPTPEDQVLPWILDTPVLAQDESIAAGNVNVDTLEAVPTGATHAIVTMPSGKNYAKLSGSFIATETTGAGEFIYLLGYIKANSI